MHRHILLIVLFIVLSLPSPALAEELPMATGEWQPYTSSSLHGYGEFTRKVSLVLYEMGKTPAYRFYPWARCYDAVLKGRLWAAFPYAYNPKRGKEVWFSDPISLSRSVFFYYQPEQSQKVIDLNHLSDAASYRIGGVTGYFYQSLFAEAEIDLDYTSSEVQGLEKLIRGRIDLMPINERVGWVLINRHFPEQAKDFHTTDFALSVNKLRLIISRTYPNSYQLRQDFNAALHRCMHKGIIPPVSSQEPQADNPQR